MINQHRIYLCNQLLCVDSNSSHMKILCQQFPLSTRYFSNLHLSSKKWRAIDVSNLRRCILHLISAILSNAFLECTGMALLLLMIFNRKIMMSMKNYFLVSIFKLFLETMCFSKHVFIAYASMNTVSSIFILTFSASKNFNVFCCSSSFRTKN